MVQRRELVLDSSVLVSPTVTLMIDNAAPSKAVSAAFFSSLVAFLLASRMPL
jgi:hypothetical protein